MALATFLALAGMVGREISRSRNLIALLKMSAASLLRSSHFFNDDILDCSLTEDGPLPGSEDGSLSGFFGSGDGLHPDSCLTLDVELDLEGFFIFWSISSRTLCTRLLEM